MNNAHNNNNSSSGDALSWVIVIICLVAFWPLGLVLLLRKISFNAKKNANSYTNYRPGQAQNQQQNSARYQPNQQQQAYYQQQTYHQQQTSQQQQTYHQQQTSSQQQSSQPQQPSGQYYQASASQQPYRAAPKAQQPFTPYSAPRAQAPQASNAQAQKAAGIKPKKVKEKKQNGKGLASFLTFLGIFFSMIGVTCVAAGFSNGTSAGFDSTVLATIWAGAFFCLGGVISFISRIGIKERIRKCNKYYAIMGDREAMSVSDMAKASGIAPKKLRKDLIYIADNGYFGESAYFDIGLDSICLSSEAAEQLRSQIKHTSETTQEKPVGSDNQYVAVINELHMLCAGTADPSICAKIQRIEEITAKIFKIVEDKPEKIPQIRRFMNYYLPTTLKLLHSYETLEKQGISGENIMSAKQDIERVLDTLAAGFEQQLDNLFKSDKIDISADINVLENLMEQDGLTNEGNIMKTSDGTLLKTAGGN